MKVSRKKLIEAGYNVKFFHANKIMSCVELSKIDEKHYVVTEGPNLLCKISYMFLFPVFVILRGVSDAASDFKEVVSGKTRFSEHIWADQTAAFNAVSTVYQTMAS